MSEQPRTDPPRDPPSAPGRGARWHAYRARLERLKRPLVAVAAVGTVLSGLAGYWNAYRAVQRDAAPAELPDPASADRRMTFAVLPVRAPAQMPDGTAVARALTEQIQAVQEARYLWARVARQQASMAAASAPSLRAIGRALNVHFLLRGTLVPGPSQASAEIAVIDAESERVLGSRTVKIDPRAAPPAPAFAIDDALGGLTYDALTVEVQRARSLPDASLDARDFAYRAYVTWGSGQPDAPGAYARASALIERALATSPDDLLALRIKAQLNLCECLQAWAKDADAKERLGLQALDRFLALRPDDATMLTTRSTVYLKHRRYDDALLVADEALRQDPELAGALEDKVLALLRLGRAGESLPFATRLVQDGESDAYAEVNGIVAAALFAHQDYAQASHYARKAATELKTEQRSDPLQGSVVLTLAAAEALQGHGDAARAALADFRAAVPMVQTRARLEAWLRPHSPVPETAVFYAALESAGLPR